MRVVSIMRLAILPFKSANIKAVIRRTFTISSSKNAHWATIKRKEIQDRAAAVREMEAQHSLKRAEAPNYEDWSQVDLIKRVTELENSLKLFNKCDPPTTFLRCPGAVLTRSRTPVTDPTPKAVKKAKKEKAFDPSKYNTRFIALKFAYLGKRYNGFEHHVGNVTPLPTVEEKVWEALIKARLIFPKPIPGQEGEVNWEGCEYSKCGRTDRGVSAFGQVIGLRVRSSRPVPKKKAAVPPPEGDATDPMAPRDGGLELASPSLREVVREQTASGTNPPSELDISDPALEESLNWDPINDELPYAALLNRLLPPDIRILAWCPAPPVDFSARFSCRERRYKYFFTNPCFLPPPENPNPESGGAAATMKWRAKSNGVKEGWLDIAAMKEAASYFVGEHDFRNFCKIDGSKQIENFHRRMYVADIIPEDDTTGALGFLNAEQCGPSPTPGNAPQVYSFTLHGSAFLWHQVRCMVSVLFLVGQGLEKPTIIKDLLDVQKNPSRPAYEMASDSPLVLWDCVFPSDEDADRKDALNWLYIGDEIGNGEKKWGSCGIAENVWEVWHEKKIDEVLSSQLLSIISKQGNPLRELTTDTWRKRQLSQKIFNGGDKAKLTGVYTPVMKKPLMDTAESTNEKYAQRKGYSGAKEMKEKKDSAREARNAAEGRMDVHE